MSQISIVKNALSSCGYAASNILAAQAALLVASQEDSGGVAAMLLDGPPGAGKTAFAKAIARSLGVNYVYTQAHPGSVPEDFLYDANVVQILRGAAGDRDAVKSERDVIELGFLAQVFKMSQDRKVVAFVDELDKASPKVDSLFLSAFQEGEVVVKGYGRIVANRKNLIWFFTKNNERDVTEPLLRRCRREYLTFPNEMLEMSILTGSLFAGGHEGREPVRVQTSPIKFLSAPLAEVLVKIANALRAKGEDIRKAPASEELLMAGRDAMRLVSWKASELVGPIVFGGLAGYREDQEVLKCIVTPEKLGDMVVAAVRKGQGPATRQELPKVDDGFVSYGSRN